MSLKKIKLITANHKRTKRNYIKRMMNDKVSSMIVSKKYGYDYWDGKRKYGYGGYKYNGSWIDIAKKIIKRYKLNKNSKIIDIGCGKGHLIYELSKFLGPKNIYGLDISKHAIKNSPIEIKKKIRLFDARKKLNYPKRNFDLAISINLIHNFEVNEIKSFIKNIVYISKNTFISTESYRNDKELFNLQCWALTCQSFYSNNEWEWIFKEFGYHRDYELIYFE